MRPTVGKDGTVTAAVTAREIESLRVASEVLLSLAFIERDTPDSVAVDMLAKSLLLVVNKRTAKEEGDGENKAEDTEKTDAAPEGDAGEKAEPAPKPKAAPKAKK